MAPYYVATYRQHISVALANKIDRAIKAIDPKADFVRYYAAGNDIHGWIERTQDGTNDYNYRRETNAKIKAIADSMIGTRSR